MVPGDQNRLLTNRSSVVGDTEGPSVWLGSQLVDWLSGWLTVGFWMCKRTWKRSLLFPCGGNASKYLHRCAFLLTACTVFICTCMCEQLSMRRQGHAPAGACKTTRVVGRRRSHCSSRIKWELARGVNTAKAHSPGPTCRLRWLRQAAWCLNLSPPAFTEPVHTWRILMPAGNRGPSSTHRLMHCALPRLHKPPR